VLDAIVPEPAPGLVPEEVDLVISGGGLRGWVSVILRFNPLCLGHPFFFPLLESSSVRLPPPQDCDLCVNSRRRVWTCAICAPGQPGFLAYLSGDPAIRKKTIPCPILDASFTGSA
jgi:hypothetical protein